MGSDCISGDLPRREVLMAMEPKDRDEIRAGDGVFHAPTGETWYVLGVDKRGGKVCVAGWPPTIADLADCTLVRRGDGITDDERAHRDRKFGGGWDG